MYPSLMFYFLDLLDSMMIHLAMFALNILHPGYFLREHNEADEMLGSSESVIQLYERGVSGRSSK